MPLSLSHDRIENTIEASGIVVSVFAVSQMLMLMSERQVDTIAEAKATKKPVRYNISLLGFFRFSGVGIFTQSLHLAGQALKYRRRMMGSYVIGSLGLPPRRGQRILIVPEILITGENDLVRRGERRRSIEGLQGAAFKASEVIIRD